MDIKDLTPEQMKKAKACESQEDLIALAKEEGVELTDEQLETLSGGEEWYEFCSMAGCDGFKSAR